MGLLGEEWEKYSIVTFVFCDTLLANIKKWVFASRLVVDAKVLTRWVSCASGRMGKVMVYCHGVSHTVPMTPVESIIDQDFWSYSFRVTHYQTVVVDLVCLLEQGSLFKQSSAGVVVEILGVFHGDFMTPVDHIVDALVPKS